MKKYLVTVVFSDGGSHSREITAKNKDAAEKEFFEDLPATVRDHVESSTVQIKK